MRQIIYFHLEKITRYGCSNIFSSFFPCFCGGASLARSCVQDNAGGRTQMVSIYSSLIVAFVLLFIAPLFKELPQVNFYDFLLLLQSN
jgi:MFS superfamily sulfate permease-like transporter